MVICPRRGPALAPRHTMTFKTQSRCTVDAQ